MRHTDDSIDSAAGIRTSLATEHASEDELLACLNHLLASTGKAHR